MVNGGDLGRASAFLKRHDLNTPTLASMLLVDLPDRDFRLLLERRRANSTAAKAAKNWFEKELRGLSEGSCGSQPWKRLMGNLPHPRYRQLRPGKFTPTSVPNRRQAKWLFTQRHAALAHQALLQLGMRRIHLFGGQRALGLSLIHI